MLPVPRTSISIRVATPGDYPFIDRLQDMHSKALGFMRTQELVEHVAKEHVLIAEERVVSCQLSVASEEGGAPAALTGNSQLTTGNSSAIGYCISVDRYFKRDDVGVVYQMNIAPSSQRKLVAATLLKEVFERAAYGCRLFSCWCAQDLAANYFWESMGFVPLAFRTGAVDKKRVRIHIFWQKRIRAGDTSTPYWYPCKTDGGHLRADRIVLPIPPGVQWSDEMPVLLPTAGVSEVQNALPGPEKKGRGGLRAFVVKPRRPQFGSPDSDEAMSKAIEKVKAQEPKRRKPKADPKHIAAARELRDRYLEYYNGEQFNAGLVLPAGKYEVARALPQAKASQLALPEAA